MTMCIVVQIIMNPSIYLLYIEHEDNCFEQDFDFSFIMQAHTQAWEQWLHGYVIFQSILI